MIDFDHAVRSAWERMILLLFRPFGLGKWCAIALGAFLASLVEGGIRFNIYRPASSNNTFFSNNDISFHTTPGSPFHSFDFHSTPTFSSTTHLPWLFTWLFLGILIPIILALLVLLTWLGARGEFIFIHNLVGNRAEFTTPWRLFARPANQAFLFLISLIFIYLFAIALPGGALFFLISSHHLFASSSDVFHPNWFLYGPLYLELAVLVGIMLTVGFFFSILHFLFLTFSLPLMFRYAHGPFTALKLSLTLVARHWGSVLALLAVKIGLFLVFLLFSYVICCATCCFGALPYVSTVLTLPFSVFSRNLSLCVLAQFGPAYDLWEPAEPPAGSLPSTA